MSAVWAFDNIENKHSLYRGKYFMKTFSISLEENAANVIHFEKKKDFTADAKRAKTSSRFNRMLRFQKKFTEKLAKVKHYCKL